MVEHAPLAVIGPEADTGHGLLGGRPRDDGDLNRSGMYRNSILK